MFSTFGKYKSHSYSNILKQDITYFQWLFRQPWFKEKYETEYKECLKLVNNPVKKKNNFTIYTDGACPHNGSEKAYMGVGIHFSIHNKVKLKDVSQCISYPVVSNNVAELKAIIMAIQLCISNNIQKDIKIYTDSKYSIDSVTKWYPYWKEKKIEYKKKNIELIKYIHDCVQNNDIELIHIKAHTNKMDEHSIGNRTADKLAKQRFKI